MSNAEFVTSMKQCLSPSEFDEFKGFLRACKSGVGREPDDQAMRLVLRIFDPAKGRLHLFKTFAVIARNYSPR